MAATEAAVPQQQGASPAPLLARVVLLSRRGTVPAAAVCLLGAEALEGLGVRLGQILTCSSHNQLRQKPQAGRPEYPDLNRARTSCKASPHLPAQLRLALFQAVHP